MNNFLAGIDWHPNLPMNQNLITREDLPRFVMDSYEECRGPPRLFLLDKFGIWFLFIWATCFKVKESLVFNISVASNRFGCWGAGTCLKHYTDPLFFKVEASYSEMTNAEVLREKKIRKSKVYECCDKHNTVVIIIAPYSRKWWFIYAKIESALNG